MGWESCIQKSLSDELSGEVCSAFPLVRSEAFTILSEPLM